MPVITIDISAEIDKLSSEQRKARDKADEMVAKITTEDRDFSKEEEAQYNELLGSVTSLGKRADRLRKMAEERGTDPAKPPRSQPNELDRPDEDAERKRSGKARREAFDRYLRYGFNGLSDEQRAIMSKSAAQVPTDQVEERAMSAILGSGGGFLCPPEMQQSIEVAMKDFSGIEQLGATVIPTGTGNDLPWPTMNDTSNEGEQIEENGAQTELNPTFGQVNLKGFMFSSKLVLIPIQLMQDSAVNIEPIISNVLGERLGRITNRRFTTGTGANQPQGVVTGSVQGKQAAGAAAITYDELVDLQHSVDPAYRTGAGWMFHDLTMAAVRKLKDSDGRPIWQPAATSGAAWGAPATLLGDRYVVNNIMPQMGSGNKSVLYGAFRKYMIRTVGGITIVRLAERYAERLQTGLFAFMRRDGRLIDAGTNPIKHLVHP